MSWMSDSELHVKKARDFLGEHAENSRIYHNGRSLKRYYAERYRIKRRLVDRDIEMLSSLGEDNRKLVAKQINNSRRINKRLYTILADDNEDNTFNIDKDKLSYYSVISVVGSRDSVLEKEAIDYVSKIVGLKTIRRARDSFNSNYKSKLKETVEEIRNNDIDGAVKTLKDLNEKTIDDVLSVANYTKRGMSGRYLLSAVESNNPLDYNRKIQIACVYLPGEEEYKAGIGRYIRNYYTKDRDKGFLLVRYDLNGKAIGSAICYIENNKFLVDSVEGHRTFRKAPIFDAVYKDLVYRAKSKGAKEIIFGTDGVNETARDFIRYLEESKDKYGLRKEAINMKLNKNAYIETSKEKLHYELYL